MTPITSSQSKTSDSKVMVSNLPLLFARGSPTSLENMCLEELQAFMKFVLKCEQNLSIVDLSLIERPPWWPTGLTETESSGSASWTEGLLQRKKEGKGKASAKLRQAIKACYAYHNCVYLLEFCRKLITFTGGKENLQVVDNRDGTRSLLNKVSRKLLVTFKSENQDYDKLQFPRNNENGRSGSNKVPTTPNSKLKQLVTSRSDNTSDPSLSKCVDVYLCDNCDKDFDRFSELLEHEKLCGKVVPVVCEEERAAQSSFLGNVQLIKRGAQKSPHKVKDSERPRATNYDKFMEIELASPLGRYIMTSSCLTLDKTNPASRGFKSCSQYLEEVETRCPGTIKSLRSSNANMEIKNKFPNTYKSSKKKACTWTHTYNFTPRDADLRLQIIRDGLKPRPLRIYRKCRKKLAKVSLKRLSEDLVKDVQARYERMERMELEEAERENKISVPVLFDRTINDNVVDELLGESFDEEMSMRPKNDIVNYENIGFRTNFGGVEGKPIKVENSSSYLVHNEAYSSKTVESEGSNRNYEVPKPLPELLRLALTSKKNSSNEILCVDLCSSDDE